MRVLDHYKRPPVKLSPRELQVQELVGQGLTSKMIAAQLGISIHTVTNHRATIKDKQKTDFYLTRETQPASRTGSDQRKTERGFQ